MFSLKRRPGWKSDPPKGKNKSKTPAIYSFDGDEENESVLLLPVFFGGQDRGEGAVAFRRARAARGLPRSQWHDYTRSSRKRGQAPASLFDPANHALCPRWIFWVHKTALRGSYREKGLASTIRFDVLPLAKRHEGNHEETARYQREGHRRLWRVGPQGRL